MMAPLQLVTLWDMLRLNAESFLDAFNMTASLGQAMELIGGQDAPGLNFAVDAHNELCAKLDLLLEHLEKLELPASHANATRIRACLASAEPHPERNGTVCLRRTEYLKLKNYTNVVRTTMADEMSARVALVIAQKNKRYFDEAPLMAGSAIVSAFPSAVYEIDEAGKCFAVGRHTACVFHLMRMMESGIHAVTRCLGIPDPIKGGDRNWGSMLRKVRIELDRRNKATPPAWANLADAALFEEAYVSLDGVRNVWRNATMHVENKYTEEEAEHIFHNVQGFMRKVAERCNEDGLPTA